VKPHASCGGRLTDRLESCDRLVNAGRGDRFRGLNLRTTKMSEMMKRKPSKGRNQRQDQTRARCGLCGKAGSLTVTECCGNAICDDGDRYVVFSYARNSCHHNHSRFTLCSYHHNEGHPGYWKECKVCRTSFETEMYVWYVTNEYNFDKLENPPTFEPTLCRRCRKRIPLGHGGYVREPNGEYVCDSCDPVASRRSR